MTGGAVSTRQLLEEPIAQGSTQRCRHLDETSVALPGFGVEQLLAPFLGQALLGAVAFIAFIAIALVITAAPFGQALFQPRCNLVEVLDEGISVFVVQRRAQLFVARGETQGLDGLERQLAVQAQRALDRRLPVAAEGGVGEDLRLGRFPEVQEGATDALDVAGCQLAVLLAKVLAQRLEPLAGVDELHLAFPVQGFAVRIWPSLERVTSDSSSPSCITLKRGSRMPSLPPIASRSFLQVLP
jgi:hypothetical protein